MEENQTPVTLLGLNTASKLVLRSAVYLYELKIKNTVDYLSKTIHATQTMRAYVKIAMC